MSQEPVPVAVRILDKEYTIACEPQQQEELIESAHLLDRRMREIRQQGRVVGTDRIAVIAALNIAHELIQIRQARAETDEEAERRLGDLQARIADALTAQHQLDARAESV